ncbi:MAG: photosystem II complex extrinsic protein PsbU [Pseudanabaenaceae cyanobacterium SKYGB_i_bin29]|nr:photosystem II complex extrinsic protein PsbU [Pseudanabaenaceae cyanobacterium SKYG29]MDW8422572.1 photosystem II complex extrinsic protein PsbU [Pseudanabaenaceae cyanobacterium SKYGB_i_bin29]
MRTLVRIFLVAVLAVALWLGAGRPVVAKSFDHLPDTNFVKVDNSKIDLNNANVLAFRRLPGMYPTLAKIIIQNAPYASLDEVLQIEGLTERQKERIKQYMDQFTLYRPDNSMQRERINNANYRL